MKAHSEPPSFQVRFQQPKIWSRQRLLDFQLESNVPHSIKRFSNVQEEAVTIFLTVVGSQNLLDDSMELLDSTVASTETELVLRGNPWASIILTIRTAISLSNTFEIEGRRLIGR